MQSLSTRGSCLALEYEMKDQLQRIRAHHLTSMQGEARYVIILDVDHYYAQFFQKKKNSTEADRGNYLE